MLQYYNHLVQGTQLWCELRAGIITSTDAAKFCGASKYETPQQCLHSKLAGTSTATTEPMARGSYYEVHAATLYMQMYPTHKYYTTGICVDSETQMGYSPDLMINDDGLVEIKCPRWGYRNQPPPEHICQIQHALGISKRHYCDYVQWHISEPDKIKIIRIYADYDFWIRQLHTCMEWHQALMDLRNQPTIKLKN